MVCSILTYPPSNEDHHSQEKHDEDRLLHVVTGEEKLSRSIDIGRSRSVFKRSISLG